MRSHQVPVADKQWEKCSDWSRKVLHINVLVLMKRSPLFWIAQHSSSRHCLEHQTLLSSSLYCSVFRFFGETFINWLSQFCKPQIVSSCNMWVVFEVLSSPEAFSSLPQVRYASAIALTADRQANPIFRNEIWNAFKSGKARQCRNCWKVASTTCKAGLIAWVWAILELNRLKFD